MLKLPPVEVKLDTATAFMVNLGLTDDQQCIISTNIQEICLRWIQLKGQQCSLHGLVMALLCTYSLGHLVSDMLPPCTLNLWVGMGLGGWVGRSGDTLIANCVESPYLGPTVYVLIFASIIFRELIEMHSGKYFADFYFYGSRRSNLQFFYIAHILCSCTRQYECNDVLDGFWGPGDGCQSDHGRIQVTKQCQDKFSRILIFA